MAATRTELAGNPLTQYPFFEYVRAFNVDSAVNVAIDPTRFPAIVGQTCNVYVVAHKSPEAWVTSPALTDVTPGGALSRSFVAGNIQANTFVVAAASTLDANAGDSLGVGYDVVLDCNQDGNLGNGDFIDGLGSEAGLYMVADTTAPGPHAVTELEYNLDAGVGATFDIPATRLGEDLFYPADIATMGKLPIVVVSHGNGHDFRWYGHIGQHLASYGFIVMSHMNDTGPGSEFAAVTTIGHTDALIDQAEAGAIAGGALAGHLDTHRIVWIGHSRGAEGVAIAYDSLFDGTATPTHYTRKDIRLVSSMLPTDFNLTDVSNPHDANYHLWTASGDTDVNGHAGLFCFNFEFCQTFHLHDRATRYRQSTIVQGSGHGDFHDEAAEDEWFDGPCPIGRATTNTIQRGYLLPLALHYVYGNVPALDFLTRQYESFRPIGVPTSNACIVVSNEYRNGAAFGNFMIDDYQTETATNKSSSGGAVSFDVDNVVEGFLNDANPVFNWNPADPFNGATQGIFLDSTRGVVFDWTGADRFYEWEVPAGARDLSKYLYLHFRGAQGTQHPNTLAVSGDLTFTVALRDASNVTSRINIGAFGGGLEEPYARMGGWHNEMEAIQVRLTDFLNNGSGLDLTHVVAVRMEFGPSRGSSEGRIVVDELMLTRNFSPLSLDILEPTQQRPTYAGTSTSGSNVLVRLVGGTDLGIQAANLAISVAGVALTPAQIPTPATQVGGETWVVIAPGPKPDGCYDLAVSLTTPAGVAAAEPQSLCYAGASTHVFDRVLAIDQTNSMNFDGTTGVSSSAKMDAAKAAAKLFVDLSNADDKIGVISFQRRDQDNNGTITDPDELAEPKFSIVTAGEGPTDQRPAARNAIDGIQPDTSPGFFGPETSPGAGLEEARTMLNGGAVAGHEPNIVLVTDGLENYAPYWNKPGPGGPLRPAYMADDIRVDAVGVGGDADDVLLADIADVTGGEFRNLNEGSGSFFLLSRLANFYKQVDERARGEQRFHYVEGFPASPGPIDFPAGTWRIGEFTAEPRLDWMTVTFHSDLDLAFEVQLLAPGATAPVVIAPPGSTLHRDRKHSVYRIRKPAPGRWTYRVRVLKPRAEFFVVASAPGSLTARMGPGQLAQQSSGDYLMPLRVWIADSQSVRGAGVSGYVRRPDGVKTPVTLLDDGRSGDGGANDGIYGLGFVARIPGAYYVHLAARGRSSAGAPFDRTLDTSFVLPGQRKKPRQYGEGLNPRPSAPTGLQAQ